MELISRLVSHQMAELNGNQLESRMNGPKDENEREEGEEEGDEEEEEEEERAA